MCIFEQYDVIPFHLSGENDSDSRDVIPILSSSSSTLYCCICVVFMILPANLLTFAFWVRALYW